MSLPLVKSNYSPLFDYSILASAAITGATTGAGCTISTSNGAKNYGSSATPTLTNVIVNNGILKTAADAGTAQLQLS